MELTLQEAVSTEFNLPVFPPSMQQELLMEYHILKREGSQDRRIWPHTADGSFTIKSYISRSSGNPRGSMVLKRIWQHFIPTKLSFFTWKLLHGVIPVDSVVARCHVPMVSKCACCTCSKEESATHLFFQSELARPIWSHFNDIFGMQAPRFPNITLLLTSWFNHGKRDSMEQFCFTITPLVIFWEIWKERCTRRYKEGYLWSPNQSSQFILKVRFWILKLFQCFTPKLRSDFQFEKIANLLDIGPKNPPLKPPMIIYWTRPLDGFVALNTDGAAKEGLAVGGGLIRDNESNHLSNFYAFYGVGTNNLAETRAILDGVALRSMLGYSKVQVQTDSKMALLWLKEEMPIPWSLQNWWAHFKVLTADMAITAIHVFREGNMAADYLSKQGLRYKSMGAINYHAAGDLKLHITSDKFNIPNIRHIKQ